MKSIKEIIENQENKLIAEASLARVNANFNSNRPVGIITTFRGDRTYDENVESNKILAKKVESAGYGFIYVDGYWIENKGQENENPVKEISLMIIGRSDDKAKVNDDMEAFLVTQAAKYDQDAFVFKPKDSKNVFLIDKKGNVLMELKNAKFDKTAEMFTTLRNGNHAGKSFVLETRQRGSQMSQMSKMARIEKLTKI